MSTTHPVQIQKVIPRPPALERMPLAGSRVDSAWTPTPGTVCAGLMASDCSAA